METINLPKPHLIIMAGILGSGKTWFAKQFAETFNAPLISLDEVRDDLFNEPSNSEEELEVINRVCWRFLIESLKTGRSIIFDGLANTKASRAELIKLAEKYKYEPVIIWVQTEPKTARSRVKKLDDTQYNLINKSFQAPLSSEKPLVISGRHNYTSQLKIVLKKLIETNKPATS